MAKRVFQYPEEQQAFEEFVEDNHGCYVWHDGAVMRVFTDSDIPE